MSNYTVVDLYTTQEFPADTLADVEQAVSYILSGEDLSDGDLAELTEVLFEVEYYGAGFSNGLGFEVVPHV